MDQSKHTPGEWHAGNKRNDHQGLVYSLETGDNIAVTYKREDAPIVAAAPDLLEACIKAVGTLTHMTTAQYARGEDKPTRELLVAAIAKATP